MEKECKNCRKAIPHGASGHEWECTAEKYDIDNHTCFEPKDEDIEEKEPVTIPFFVHENDMMHKDMDNERLHEENKRMHNTIRNICVTFVVIIVIFVTAYTVRMFAWNETVTRLNAMIVELANRSEVSNAENVSP